MTTPTGVPGAEPSSSRSLPVRILRRTLYVLGLIVLANLLFWTADDMFTGYPQVHSDVLTIIAVVAMALGGCAIWIVDERRHRGDDD
jgi:Co/Zn/Cd efflux system component